MKVIYGWPRPGIRQQGIGVLSCHQLRYLACRVSKITEVHCLAFTAGDTERLKSPIHPVRAQGTLFHKVCLGIEAEGLIGADGYAGLAAVASIAIYQHSSIITFIDCGKGAGVYTRWFSTMHTESRQVVHADIRKLPAGGIDAPSTHCIHTDPRTSFYVVLQLTGDGTGMAPNTPLQIDYNTESL